MNSQYCFIEQALPSKENLQAAIDSLGFGLKLDTELDLNSDEGFSPCKLNDYDDVGFEIECGTIDELFDEDEAFEKQIGNRKNYISMSWGGNFEDCLCVLITALAMVKSFDAVTTYDCEEADSIEDIEGGIQECLKELGKG
mgnify:CR=1 FL=1